MITSHSRGIAAALTALLAVAITTPIDATPVAKPVAGQQVRFPQR